MDHVRVHRDVKHLFLLFFFLLFFYQRYFIELIQRCIQERLRVARDQRLLVEEVHLPFGALADAQVVLLTQFLHGVLIRRTNDNLLLHVGLVIALLRGREGRLAH